MLKFTRRGWLASLLGALAAAFLPRTSRAGGAAAAASIAPAPAAPRQRKRWIGHY